MAKQEIDIYSAIDSIVKLVPLKKNDPETIKLKIKAAEVQVALYKFILVTSDVVDIIEKNVDKLESIKKEASSNVYSDILGVIATLKAGSERIKNYG